MSIILLAISCLYLLTLGFALPLLGKVEFVTAALLAPPLVWLSVADLRHHIIPDLASFSVGIIGLVQHYILSGALAWPTVLAAALVVSFFWLGGEIYFRKTGHEGLGIGDAKLLAAGTLCVGAGQFWILLLLAALGGIAAILLSERRNLVKGKSAVPFGPFIAYSLFLTFLFLRAS